MNPKDKLPLVHVVAGVLRDGAGRVLLAQRPEGKHLAGGWEFPGGKLEPGEARIDGLRRELNEELGVTLQTARPLMRLTHAYPTRTIDLDVWLVTGFRGEPRPLDGQRLRWCERESLGDAGLLAADVAVVTALHLPERIATRTGPGYRIDDAQRPGPAAPPGAAGAADLLGIRCASLPDAIAAVAGGADFIVLRRDLPASEITALCAAVAVPVFAHGIEPAQAWALGASGVSDLPP